MHCKKCGALSGTHELCPKCRGWLVVARGQQRPNVKPIKFHEAVLQLLAGYACTPIRSTFRTRHERNLMVLDNVLSFSSADRAHFGYEHEMMRAFDSVKFDCTQLRKLRTKIHAEIVAPTGPLGAIAIQADWRSWIWAMDYLASYRALLRGNEQQLGKFSMCVETVNGGPMFHNFTRIMIGNDFTNVCIHNSKKVNGEGGTRVICFVRQQQGVWTSYFPKYSEINDAFQISARAELYDKTKLQVDNAFEDIHRKNLSLKGMQAQLSTLENPKKISGIQIGIQNIRQKKQLLSLGNSERWNTMVQAKQSFRTTGSVKILDLSYDDLYSGLCQLMRTLQWSEAQLGEALLGLLGCPGSSLVADLATEVEISGIKVKDLVKPREDTKITDVKISGLDLCMSLMSIMFITEPKHSLPMAISNLDALRAMSLGLIPLDVLFAPIEVVLSEGRSMFRVGSSSSNLGGLIASANNQRVVLDPSILETRLIKERSMPVTELSLTTGSPGFSVSLQQGLAQLTQQISWGDQREVRAAAFFFPFIKCVALRAILENASSNTKI